VRWIVRMVGGCLLAALVLGACGDDDGISGAQQEAADRADAVCVEVQDAVGRTLGDEAAKERDVVQRAAERLEQMEEPSEEEPTWTRIVAEMNNLWLQLSDVAEAQVPEVNDQARARTALNRANETNDRIKELASKYGMKACAEGFGRA
jgi:DNA repair ATPase RecN